MFKLHPFTSLNYINKDIFNNPFNFDNIKNQHIIITHSNHLTILINIFLIIHLIMIILKTNTLVLTMNGKCNWDHHLSII